MLCLALYSRLVIPLAAYPSTIRRFSSLLAMPPLCGPSPRSSRWVPQTLTMLLPLTSLLVGGGKDGALWVLNQATGQMGHLQGGAGNPPVVQTFEVTTDLVTTG